MSIGSHYVRARDGALYKNPVLVFPEGFICFDETEEPELVIWIPPGELTAEGGHEAVKTMADVLRRVFGEYSHLPGGYGVDLMKMAGTATASERVVPGTEPFEFMQGLAVFFEVAHRIPRPTMHDGTERYASRVEGTVYDWPADPLDASRLEMGEIPQAEEANPSKVKR